MLSVNVEVLLKHLVRLHNSLCATKAKSKNKIITALLEKDCNHLLRVITTLNPMLEEKESMRWGVEEAAAVAASISLELPGV